MSDGTKIEWTDATWNPITGCSVVSSGCTNCYAMRLAGGRMRHEPSRSGLTRDTKAGPVWTGEVRFNERWLDQPLRWTKPRMIFVCAHGDLFAEGVPDTWIDQVFGIMAFAPQHVFQVLTKRPERMRAYLRDPETPRRAWDAGCDLSDALGGGCYLQAAARQGAAGSQEKPWNAEPWPLRNVWPGVSVEDQRRAHERIPILLNTPAAVRWVSAEPLLGPVDLRRVRRFAVCPNEYVDALVGSFWTDQTGLPNPDPSWAWPGRLPLDDRGRELDHYGLDWVVAGGESGPGARPMHPEWARSLRDQCAGAGVPFLFKQWGEFAPEGLAAEAWHVSPNGTAVPDPLPNGLGRHVKEGHWRAYRVGKKAAGRLLDGVTHDGFPARAP